MSRVAVAASIRPIPPRRPAVPPTPLRPRPTPTGRRGVGCNQPIYTTNMIQRIGYAELSDAGAEQVNRSADGAWQEISEEIAP